MNIKSLSEHEEQKLLVDIFHLKYKGVLIHAIANGGHRHIAVAVKLKAEGVLSGIPDLYIPAWNLWIEVKTTTGKLSHAQKQCIAYLKSIGDTVIVAYGSDDGLNKINEFLAQFPRGGPDKISLKAQNDLNLAVFQLLLSSLHPIQ